MAPLQGPASSGARRGGQRGPSAQKGGSSDGPAGVDQGSLAPPPPPPPPPPPETPPPPPPGQAPPAATEATAALTTRGTGDLRGGVAEGRADLVDLELDDGALLAFLRVEGALLEPAADDDARTAGQRLGDVLGRLAPDVAAEEQGLAVLPLLRLTVEGPRCRRHGEVGDGSARRREAQFRIGGQVADDGDDDFAGHGQWTSGRISLVRSTDSFRLSWRSSSATAAGSASMSTMA